jgi:lipopolysaccharide/colanic/teichoic acid biosynthesis glycosyltransferase
VLKRSVDIALACLLLIVSLPILAMAAIAIKINSEGPVFFCQPRMGLHFKRFALFKLRTMRVLVDGSAYTLGEDPRITRVGQWLRRTKVDELPQLLNVLRGEMSLVGPRPVIPELALEFHQEYDRLLEVRPGLTDPATLKYCREVELLAMVPDPLVYFKTVVTPDKLRISAAYLDQASVWSDLGVIARTAAALVPSKSLPRFAHKWFPEQASRLVSAPLFAADIPSPVPVKTVAPQTIEEQGDCAIPAA